MRATVTGAASGIGRATALRLRADGYDVLGVDLDADGLVTLAAPGIRTLVADVASAGSRDEIVAASEGATALVNVAAVISLQPIFDVTPEDLRATYAVNVEAVWDLTSRIGRTMPQGGAIVNVSSNAAKHPTYLDSAPYASSKAAVLSITRSFAYALAPAGVRVNAICPGATDTPGRDAVLAQQGRTAEVPASDLATGRIAGIPLGRVGTAEECAGLIAFLLSADAGYMTGQAINHTGGQVTW
jgi:NAD(P)-dependent dehydrogenase (short-subunit alcohol dehydrogenase family)